MPLLWGAIASFISYMIVPILSQVMVALGVGVVSYVGFSIVIDELVVMVQGHLSGIPLIALNIMNLFGFDSAIGIIFSTATALVTLHAITGATRMTWKKPGSTYTGQPF